MYLNFLANISAFIAVILYILTLLPAMVRVLFPDIKTNKIVLFSLKNRRNIGILAFFFALFHGVWIGIERNLDFGKLETYFKYFQGLSLITIFTLLAVTSNNWSVRHLKKNWRRLHYLTFVALFILPWHVIDKMYGNWSFLTPIVLFLSFIFIAFFIWRNIKEYRNGKK